MARTLRLYAPSGLATPTAVVYPDASDTATETITLTEATNKKGYYSGTVASAGAGDYAIVIKSGTSAVGIYNCAITAGANDSMWARDSILDTQKVDVNTIKTQAVTCAAGVTVRTDVGAAAAPGSANGMLIGGSNAATTFASMTVTAAMTNGSTVLGNTTVGTLGVGATTLSALTVTNNLLVSGTSTYTGNVLHSGTTTLTGALTLTAGASLGALTATTYAGTSITLSGALQAATIVSTGTTTLNALTVTGACTHGSTAFGNTTMGTLTQTGACSLGATSTVTMAAFTVTGACTHGSTVQGNTTIGTITQTGAASWGATTFASMALTSGTIPVDIQTIKGRALTDPGGTVTANTNLGTTQPVNFTGTGATAYAKTDVTQIATAAVSATTAQIGVNVVNWGGTALASSVIPAGWIGTGTGQLSVASGVVAASGNWNVGKTGYTAAPTAGSIVTASFGTCVTPETTKTALLPAVAAGAKSGLPILDASTGLILTGFGGGAATTSPTAGSIVTASFGTCDFTSTMKTSIGTAVAASAVASVTAAVTLPSIPANWITATGITAAALNGKGDWNIGKTGYTAAPTTGSIVTASFGTCVTPETTKTALLPAAAAGAASGLPIIAAAGGYLNVTNLPQVVHSAAGGLPTVGTSTGQVNLSGGRADSNVMYVDGAAWHSATAGRIGANLSTMYDVGTQSMTGASVNQTGDNFSLLGTPASSGPATIAHDIANISSAIVIGQPTNVVATDGSLVRGTARTNTLGVPGTPSTYLDSTTTNSRYFAASPTTATTVNGIASTGLWQQCTILCGAARANYITVIGSFRAGASRFCNVYAYNYATLAWDLISNTTNRMNTSGSDLTYGPFYLLLAHQKNLTAGDGEVTIAFVSPSTTTTDILAVDYFAVATATAAPSAAQIADAVKQNSLLMYYPNGVWIDSINGASGTAVGTNGVRTNPVLTLEDAITINASLNQALYSNKTNSTLILDVPMNYTTMEGPGGWYLQLGDQAINGATIRNCELITGHSTSPIKECFIWNCQIADTEWGEADFHDCHITGTTTLVQDAPYLFDSCVFVPMTTTPIIDFNSSANDRRVVMGNCSGMVLIKNMKASNILIIDGGIDVTIDNTNTAGTVYIGAEVRLTYSGTGQTVYRAGATFLPEAVSGAANGLALVGSIMGKSPATLTTADVTGNLPANVIQWNSGSLPTIGTSTLTQAQVSGGAYDLTNATYIAALKAGLGTVPASGNWNVGKTGYEAAPTAGSIVTASFGACVTPETTKTALLPAVAAGALGGVAIQAASGTVQSDAAAALTAKTEYPSAASTAAAASAAAIELNYARRTGDYSTLAASDILAGDASKIIMATGKVSVPDNQKVDVNTIKTATVAATSTVTFANGTVSTYAGADTAGTTTILADYQQRGVAVTLPAAPAGYGGTTDATAYTGAFSALVLANTPVGPSGLSPQNVRDAMKLAPTSGAAAAGSIDLVLTTAAADVAGLDGAAMRGTDSAMLAANYTAPDNANIGVAATQSTAAAASAAAVQADYQQRGVAVTLPGTPPAGYGGSTNASDYTGAFTALVLANTPTGTGLTAQQTRDAMKLAPTSGAGAAGSIDVVLGTVAVDVAGLDGAAMRGTDGAMLAANYVAPLDATQTQAADAAAILAYAPAKAGDAMTLTTGERTSLAAAVWNALTSTITLAGSIGKFIIDALNALGPGTGARTVTLTVTDGTNPLQNANVRVTMGSETYKIVTGLDGVATFCLDDGTWAVAISKPFYTFASTTIAISDNTTHTYAMTVVSIPASDPGFVTGYLYCYDEAGEIEEGVVINVELYGVAGTGMAWDTTLRTATSDATGLVTFTNMPITATYRIRRGTTANWKDIAIPTSSISPFAIPNIYGKDD